jgi:hypothetical protein
MAARATALPLMLLAARITCREEEPMGVSGGQDEARRGRIGDALARYMAVLSTGSVILLVLAAGYPSVRDIMQEY